MGFGAFAVALLKRAMQRRACVALAGAVFVVLLCAVGLEDKAQAQFGPPTVTDVNPNTGPTSGGTRVTITGTNFSGATAVRFGSNGRLFHRRQRNPNHRDLTSWGRYR